MPLKEFHATGQAASLRNSDPSPSLSVSLSVEIFYLSLSRYKSFISLSLSFSRYRSFISPSLSLSHFTSFGSRVLPQKGFPMLISCLFLSPASNPLPELIPPSQFHPIFSGGGRGAVRSSWGMSHPRAGEGLRVHKWAKTQISGFGLLEKASLSPLSPQSQEFPRGKEGSGTSFDHWNSKNSRAF